MPVHVNHIVWKQNLRQVHTKLRTMLNLIGTVHVLRLCTVRRAFVMQEFLVDDQKCKKSTPTFTIVNVCMYNSITVPAKAR